MLSKTDILVIGSGIAGLSSALKLADNFKVTIVTKREAMEANTRYAQGGIASVTSETDNFESHIKDTHTAGAGLCHDDIVLKIVKDGPRLIDQLVAWGVEFSKRDDKSFDLGKEGGHSKRRVLHAGDITGNELESALLRKARSHPNVTILEHHVSIDLITTQKINPSSQTNECLGVYVLDTKTKKIKTLEASYTILATGGAGKVYLYTSNPDVATGDGMAMAHRAGATMANLEFVQFHPTCLYNPSQAAQSLRTFLISEAVRGEGGILKTLDGKAFMEKHHPLKDLAPRDIVARAIDFEMKKNGHDYVLLDLSHKGADFIKSRFPNIYEGCLKAGFDMTKVAVPVVPAAHYFCGGVLTNEKAQTSIDNLYAVGETACTGLHGANRLASNSLLEAIAMADYASRSILEDKKRPTSQVSIPTWNAGNATDSNDAVVITQNWDEIRRFMWNYVGIVRSNKRLERAKHRIQLLAEEIKEYYWNFTLTRDLIELRNLACVAEMLIDCALKRKESRGLHFNIDYPESLDTEKKDTLL
ncbi:L-aspartate oxidase [bacterium]|nr:L-aspartate oxidase [bacterium]